MPQYVKMIKQVGFHNSEVGIHWFAFYKDINMRVMLIDDRLGCLSLNMLRLLTCLVFGKLYQFQNA